MKNLKPIIATTLTLIATATLSGCGDSQFGSATCSTENTAATCLYGSFSHGGLDEPKNLNNTAFTTPDVDTNSLHQLACTTGTPVYYKPKYDDMQDYTKALLDRAEEQ